MAPAESVCDRLLGVLLLSVAACVVFVRVGCASSVPYFSATPTTLSSFLVQPGFKMGKVDEARATSATSPLTDASKMLEAALQQMDGIISG
ncbi:Hypothetical predicted protein [Cloeon dipterum]|uniref:Uncharacterized protein n=1 Tax=Cloeon dipterum TaxID=197152 RepID=A0A8S1CQ73_9INSE|nr:Hypothetical predicted protein [Cloeon dipterum]